jgi:selenocysteine lyase/cysteine desulfurase
VTEALSPESLACYREEMPVTERYVYLNHAGVAPTSRRVCRAVTSWVENLAEHGVLEEEGWEKGAEATRAAFARLVGSSPTEVAFVRNTSHGLGLVAEGLPWREGDEVAVAASVEYPSNVYPWLHLRDRGVSVREIPTTDGAVTLDAVAGALTDKTRLLAVSSAQYATGSLADLNGMGALCRERGVLFCVDGIQTVGGVATDVKAAKVDFLSADSHKWMLGLNGGGALYVNQEVADRLRPVLVGWKSTTDAWNFDRAHFELRRDALKLEEGSPSYASILGMGAALSLLEEVGHPVVFTRIEGLVARLAARLEALDCEVGPTPELRRHILTFTHPAKEAAAVHQALTDRKIIVSLRRGRIRVSPHFYNTEAELDTVAEVVEEALKA